MKTRVTEHSCFKQNVGVQKRRSGITKSPPSTEATAPVVNVRKVCHHLGDFSTFCKRIMLQ